MSMSSLEEPSSSALSDETESSAEVKCSNCEISISSNEVLNCSTCVSSSEKSKSFCNVCIGAHTRRGHKIIDHSGYEISVCDEHKTINDLFCSQCSHVLCSKCILNHRQR